MAEQPRTLLTISRQLGAGGAVLGQRLAQRLDFLYLDRELLRLAAERIGAEEHNLAQWDERISRFWDRLAESFSIGPPENIYTGMYVPPPVRDEQLFEAQSRIILEAAQRHSAVFIGRAAFWVLRNKPGLFRVFLHAPPEWRVPIVRQAYQLPDDKEARALIDRMDSDRERFIRTITGQSMSDARNYDLAINTQNVTLKEAEEMVVKILEHRTASEVLPPAPH